MMLGKCNASYAYGDSSFDAYDDNSSLDSGIERSYENGDFPIGTTTPTKAGYQKSQHIGLKWPKKRQYKNSKVTVEEFEELEKEFQPFTEAQTSTPVKPKRRYAQGKSRISRSQSPTQIVKIRKYRRIKANDRERNRMHSLNEALGELNDLNS